ncbi:MAG: MoxR family ATPase [Gemmatimonadota bacterium]|nr:MoxR family ATPase [Gemmatimonadota bacterium]
MTDTTTDTVTSTDVPQSLDLLEILIDEIERVFHGKEEVVRLAVAALLARGHILFEDVPGVGKTTLSRALGTALGLSFRRIQFTSDLLPSDVLGVSIFNPRTSEFETRLGPIFTNLVLADEINRAPPRTQSGLLQAMQEGEISLDDKTFQLPQPFMVMATQNPLEHHGTYPLPESQVDRFLMRLTIGYPGESAERQILMESTKEDPWEDRIKAVLKPAQVVWFQQKVSEVEVEDSLVGYVMDIVQRTRVDARLQMGVSPRGAIGLLGASRAYALLSGRDFLVPSDVQKLAMPCLAHRILPVGAAAASHEAHEEAGAIVQDILQDVAVPV